MEQYLKIIFPEDVTIFYYPKKTGRIELRKLTERLAILKIYFEKLLAPIEEMEFYDPATEVMLTNYPVNINSLDELDGKSIEIKKGWDKPTRHTMLNIWEGQEINNSKIRFEKKTDGSFLISWTGWYGESNQSLEDDVFLSLIAFPANDVVTPLCLHDQELIRLFDK